MLWVWEVNPAPVGTVMKGWGKKYGIDSRWLQNPGKKMWRMNARMLQTKFHARGGGSGTCGSCRRGNCLGSGIANSRVMDCVLWVHEYDDQ